MTETANITARDSRRFNVALVLIVVAITALRFGPNLLRSDLYDGDATHHVFWAYKYADPELFQNDFASVYFASEAVVPPGYLALYKVLAPLLDAQLAAELVGVVLFLASIFLVSRLASKLPGESGMATMWILVLFLVVAIEELYLLPPMGLQRSFALPLTLWALVALMNRQLVQLGVVFLLASLFYPIICATLGVFAALVLGPTFLKERRLPKNWLPLLVLGCTALALIGLRQVPDDIGPMVTKAQAMTMPEFGPEGRQRLFGDGFRGFLAHHRTGLGLPFRWLCLTFVFLLILCWQRGLNRIPREVWMLTLAALSVWAVARGWLFHLYLPQRHTAWALPVFSTVAAAASLPILMRGLSPRATRFCIVAAALAVLAYFGNTAIEKLRVPVNHDLENAYAYLRDQPKDTLVAAHPFDADQVPMRARRSVLVSRENAISFMLGYYARVQERLVAALDATYATDWKTVDDLAAKYGVDVFLVTPLPWSQDGYDEPFDDRVRTLISEGRTKEFVLQNPPPDRVLFRSGDVSLVRVGQNRRDDR